MSLSTSTRPVPASRTEGVLRALSSHIGEDKAISCEGLALRVTMNQWSAVDEASVLTAIAQLRLAGHPVCGNMSTGYCMAETEGELLRTCEELYRQAVRALEQIAALRKVGVPDLRGQLRLPS